MFWNVPEAGANMGGMTFVAATFATMVPFLRVIFSQVLLYSATATL